jgi:hypothetical protein
MIQGPDFFETIQLRRRGIFLEGLEGIDKFKISLKTKGLNQK